MTVVVACHYLSTAVVVADCRVSYPRTGVDCVDDNLRKLYRFSDRVILGFAGPLKGANAVLETVRKNEGNYSKPKIASNLISDMERWIRHTYRNLDPEDRENLQFILAAVEPNREPQVNLIENLKLFGVTKMEKKYQNPNGLLTDLESG